MPGMFPACTAFQRRATTRAPPKARGAARCWKAPEPPGADSQSYLPRFGENAMWDGIGARPGRKCPIWHVRGMGRRPGAWCGVLLGWVVRGGRLRCGNATFWGPKASVSRTSADAVRERDVSGPGSVANPHLSRSSKRPPSREGAREGAGERDGRRARQRLRREAKNSLSWGPATWIMITTMRMTPLMVSWMSESILRAMMILSMTS